MPDLARADDPTVPTLTSPCSTYSMVPQDDPFYPEKTKDTRVDPSSASPYSYYKVGTAWVKPTLQRPPGESEAKQADRKRVSSYMYSGDRDDRRVLNPAQRSFTGTTDQVTIGQPNSRQAPDFGDGNYAAIVLGSLLLVAIATGITLVLRYQYLKRNVRAQGASISRASQNGRSNGHSRQYELPFLTPLNSDSTSFLSRARNGTYDTAKNPSLKLYDEIPYIRGGELIGSGDSVYLRYKEPEEPPELPPRPLTLGCESEEKSQERREDGDGQKTNVNTGASVFSASDDNENVIIIGKKEHSTGEGNDDSEASNGNEQLQNMSAIENTKDEENHGFFQSRHTGVTVLPSIIKL